MPRGEQNRAMHKPSFFSIPLLCLAASLTAADLPAWRALPSAEPTGKKTHTGAYVVKDRGSAAWKKPPFAYNEGAATGRKHAKVIVVIYNPVLESEGGKTLIEHVRANDPIEYSHILANVIREASWGYVNYEIVDFITVDGYMQKVDGFRY